MCTSYEVMLQVVKGTRWVTVESITIPSDDMPLCGCWLFTKEEDWPKIEEAHRASGNEAKLPQTKEDVERLEEIIKAKLWEMLEKLEQMWGQQRILVERIM